MWFWPYYLHNADNMANKNHFKTCQLKYKRKELQHIKFQNIAKTYFTFLTWKQQKRKKGSLF
jgi:hypothetical protein